MFSGMGDEEWEIIKSALPVKEKRSRGMHHANFRSILNSILWITINGAPWHALPRHPQFASKSSSHRWLLRWQRNGTWQIILERLLKIAAHKDLIDPNRLLIDGSFSPCKAGG